MLTPDPASLKKTVTGFDGFDEITGGGLPQGRTSIVMGGPGSGKTVFALQTLINGARLSDERGIFVALEENSRSVIANAASFATAEGAYAAWQARFLRERGCDLVQGDSYSRPVPTLKIACLLRHGRLTRLGPSYIRPGHSPWNAALPAS